MINHLYLYKHILNAMVIYLQKKKKLLTFKIYMFVNKMKQKIKQLEDAI
jgi:hypothetical protein